MADVFSVGLFGKLKKLFLPLERIGKRNAQAERYHHLVSEIWKILSRCMRPVYYDSSAFSLRSYWQVHVFNLLKANPEATYRIDIGSCLSFNTFSIEPMKVSKLENGIIVCKFSLADELGVYELIEKSDGETSLRHIEDCKGYYRVTEYCFECEGDGCFM